MGIIKVFLLLVFLSAVNCKIYDMIDPQKYCTVDITIALDFSKDMRTKTNIENLVNFVLYNFTNNLPFFKTNVTISLLTYGTGKATSSDYYNNYDSFKNEVLKRFNELDGNNLQPSNLTEMLIEYQNFLSTYYKPNAPAKLVVFTAANNKVDIKSALDISPQIKSSNDPNCLNGSTDYNCTKIIVIGINQNETSIFDLGNWIALAHFNNYTLFTPDNNFSNENLDDLVELSLTDLFIFMCTQVIDVETVPCGDDYYCPESICTNKKNGCYNYRACINRQCIYWDLSVKNCEESNTTCAEAGASTIIIENEEFQNDIHVVMADTEYWLNLNSLYSQCISPDWIWQYPNGTTVPLYKTEYKNWGSNQPSPINNDWCGICVTDSKKLNWTSRWHTRNNFIACMKPAYELEKIKMSSGESSSGPPTPNDSCNTSRSSPSVFTIYSPENLYTKVIYRTETCPRIKYIPRPKYIGVESVEEEEIIEPRKYEIIEEQFPGLNMLKFPDSTRNHVKSYYHFPSHRMVAIKFIRISRAREKDERKMSNFDKLLREAKNIETLKRTPNVVDFYGFCIDEGYFDMHGTYALLCMELMDLSLADFYFKVHKSVVEMNEVFIGYLIVNIVNGMISCYSHKIMHRDIKPANILLNYNGSIKLCDFGVSRVLVNSLATTNVGTFYYWSPEKILQFLQNRKNKFDIRSDIWSLGITILEVLLGLLPYYIPPNIQVVIDEAQQNEQESESEDQYEYTEKNLFAIANFITKTRIYEIIKEKIEPKYSKNLCDFLYMCLKDVTERPRRLNELKEKAFYMENDCMEKATIAKNFMACFNHLHYDLAKKQLCKDALYNFSLCISGCLFTLLHRRFF